jgi:hypothetical protein
MTKIWRPPTLAMKGEVVDFIQRLSDVLNSVQENTNLTRAKKLQREGYRHLTALAHEVVDHKKKAVNRGDQNRANYLLCVEFVIDAYRSELRMWMQLKNKMYDSAWNSLVSTQNRIRAAQRAHEVSEKYYLERHAKKLNNIETRLGNFSLRSLTGQRAV